ncbi:hypothetical protein NQ315_002919 [Exocentrus adspersus]|uniref:C2H2-type domain-containing protein n=1 Tax=Exocentrus adspersus TaxID=1586481 RepID=A0AAV8V661_9CUCU|nr:hypothetical protein NQ315_002919 [Exocentrus adspersus]
MDGKLRKLEKSRICALCSNTFLESNLRKILKITREILSVLLIQLNSNENGLVMCEYCANKVRILFGFKSACLYTEDFITPFVRESSDRIDIKEVFIREKGCRELLGILYNKNLCRLCMSLADVGATCLDEKNSAHGNFVKYLINKCIPEINVDNTTKDAVVCDACIESLKDYSDFLDLCSCIDKKNDFHIKTEEIQIEMFESLLENHQEGFNEMEQSRHELDSESRSIPNNPEATSNDQHLSVSIFNACDKKASILPVINLAVEQLKDDLKCCKPPQRNSFKTRGNQGQLQGWCICNLCGFKTGYKWDLNTHMQVHKNPLEMKWLKCALCDYKAKQKKNLKTHMLIHKTPTEIKWFRCDLCNYKTKQKVHLKTHMLVHKDSTEIKWFQCASCDYKAKQRSNLNRHMLIHKHPTDIKWFQCALCNYKAKHKKSLEIHIMLLHKDPTKIKWFQCALCDYKAKQKKGLQIHMLVHKNPTEIKWFRCDLCNYKTKQKVHLKTHMLVHKDPTEIKWFQCASCDYKAKQRSNLNRHMLIHKHPTDIKWFQCALCNYKAKQKKSLEIHIMLLHKDPTKIKWFQCALCDYKAKQKKGLQIHMLVHKNPTEIEWYQCALCDYKAKQKSNLNTHMLIHKHSTEIKWFQCALCDYKAKEKALLKLHMLVHKDPTEIKFFQCALCDYKAKRKSNLNSHMLIHKHPTEIKWFQCVLCDYKAKAKRGLKRHNMLVHKTPTEIEWDLEWTPVQEVIKAKAAKVYAKATDHEYPILRAELDYVPDRAATHRRPSQQLLHPGIKKTTADREATLTSEHAPSRGHARLTNMFNSRFRPTHLLGRKRHDYPRGLDEPAKKEEKTEERQKIPPNRRGGARTGGDPSKGQRLPDLPVGYVVWALWFIAGGEGLQSEMDGKLRKSEKCRICALCSNTFLESNLRKILKITREILSVLLIQLNSNENGLVMCEYCANKVRILFGFKSACLYTEDFITPFVRESSDRIDIKEVFIREKGCRELVDILHNKNLCRLCMSLTDVGATCLGETNSAHGNFVKYLINKCIPEINVDNTTKDAVVCDACIESLKDYSDFLDLCSCIDKKNDFHIKTEEIQIEMFESRLLENHQEGFNEMEQSRHELDSESRSIPNNPEATSNDQHLSVSIFNACDKKASILPVINFPVEQLKDDLKCCKPPQRNSFKTCGNQEIKWFGCDLCDYRSKQEAHLKTHMLVHKDSTEIKWFQCASCEYKAKRKALLKLHMLVHKDPTEIKFFQCALCDYKAKRKKGLKLHMLVHKNPTEIKWYQCASCDYKAKQRYNLNTHMLIHKHPTEIKWFQCALCDYKAKEKTGLKIHMLVHKNPTEIKWYQCASCDYKAKRKALLKLHMLVHKDPTEIKFFQCALCDYKAKRKKGLKLHMLVHKDPTEIKWYQCASCDYKAKQRYNLNTHMLIHKHPTEIEWLKCASCDYKAKRKSDLNKHMLAHK